jgi:DNA-binding GntR family transcriptional regulator
VTAPDGPAQTLSQGLGRDLTTQLRALILDGTIAPGSKLLPSELQQRFGVSHIPVREAFRALESEGLIVTLARRGTRVAEVSLRELHEVYSLRRSIEPRLMAQAVTARVADHAERAREAHAVLHHSVDGPVNLFLIAHHAFHVALLQPAMGPLTERVLQQLWAVSERYVRMTVTAFHMDRVATHDHAALLDAYLDGDADAAAHETAHHLQLVENTTVTALSDVLLT